MSHHVGLRCANPIELGHDFHVNCHGARPPPDHERSVGRKRAKPVRHRVLGVAARSGALRTPSSLHPSRPIPRPIEQACPRPVSAIRRGPAICGRCSGARFGPISAPAGRNADRHWPISTRCVQPSPARHPLRYQGIGLCFQARGDQAGVAPPVDSSYAGRSASVRGALLNIPLHHPMQVVQRRFGEADAGGGHAAMATRVCFWPPRGILRVPHPDPPTPQLQPA